MPLILHVNVKLNFNFTSPSFSLSFIKLKCNKLTDLKWDYTKKMSQHSPFKYPAFILIFFAKFFLGSTDNSRVWKISIKSYQNVTATLEFDLLIALLSVYLYTFTAYIQRVEVNFYESWLNSDALIVGSAGEKG